MVPEVFKVYQNRSKDPVDLHIIAVHVTVGLKFLK